jgi:hypothetical protein
VCRYERCAPVIAASPGRPVVRVLISCCPLSRACACMLVGTISHSSKSSVRCRSERRP